MNGCAMRARLVREHRKRVQREIRERNIPDEPDEATTTPTGWTLTVYGKTMTATKWAVIGNIHRNLIIIRLKRGWTPQAAVFGKAT